MPIYSYTCEDCGHEEDQLVRLDESDREPCSACGGTSLTRAQINETSFALRGEGWSSSGYRSTKPLPGQGPVPGATKMGQVGETTVYRAPPNYKTKQLKWDGDKPLGPSEHGKNIAERNKAAAKKAKEGAA